MTGAGSRVGGGPFCEDHGSSSIGRCVYTWMRGGGGGADGGRPRVTPADPRPGACTQTHTRAPGDGWVDGGGSGGGGDHRIGDARGQTSRTACQQFAEAVGCIARARVCDEERGRAKPVYVRAPQLADHLALPCTLGRQGEERVESCDRVAERHTPNESKEITEGHHSSLHLPCSSSTDSIFHVLLRMTPSSMYFFDVKLRGPSSHPPPPSAPPR